MTKLEILKQLQEALATVQRAVALIEAKDREIGKLREELAMVRWTAGLADRLRNAKLPNDWVN